MTSTPNPACPLCGLRYASRPLLQLHIREDHRPRRRARSGRSGVVGGARASSPAAGSSSRRSGLAFRPSRAVKEVTAMTATRRSRSGQVLTVPRRVLRALRHVNDELLRASVALMRPARAPQPGPRAEAVGQSGGRGRAFGARRATGYRLRRSAPRDKPPAPASGADAERAAYLTGPPGQRWQQASSSSRYREKEGDMTGTTTLGLISIAIVLARFLALSVRAPVGVCWGGGVAAAGAEA
jgi:hypothetical protein